MNGVHDVGSPCDATDRKPAAKSLGCREQVRDDPEVLAREHLAGPGHAGLHFVCDKDDPVFLAVVRQPRKEALPGNDDTALTLHGFHEQASDPIPAVVHRGDRQIRTHLTAALGRRPTGTAVGVAEWLAVDLRSKRPEARLVGHCLGGERHGEQGPAVEGVVEHDDCLTAGE